MQYIEAPSNESPIHPVSVFLAGGITLCPDWQKEAVEAIKDLPITVYNPRRKDFDVSFKEQTVEQIKWEFEKLREASNIIFWFCKETICPITLFEYGSALERTATQGIFLGSDPEYQRLMDLQEQTKLRLGKAEIYSTVRDLVSALVFAHRSDPSKLGDLNHG